MDELPRRILKEQFLTAAKSLVSFQKEMASFIADDLGSEPYDYFLLQIWKKDFHEKGVIPVQSGTFGGEMWQWSFHGRAIDVTNIHDGRCVQINFGPGGRVDCFTEHSVVQFVCSTCKPWPEFPELSEFCTVSNYEENEEYAGLIDLLFGDGSLLFAGPELVQLKKEYTFINDKGVVEVALPDHFVPGHSSDLHLCENLVLAQK